MIKSSPLRRVLNAAVALVTWGAAAAGVLWFYDWVNRWYVVVGVVLAIVAGAIVVERLTGHDTAESAAVGVLPLQRDTDMADAAWPAPVEQQIA